MTFRNYVGIASGARLYSLSQPYREISGRAAATIIFTIAPCTGSGTGVGLVAGCTAGQHVRQMNGCGPARVTYRVAMSR
jgi:hypothetical protein